MSIAFAKATIWMGIAEDNKETLRMTRLNTMRALLLGCAALSGMAAGCTNNSQTESSSTKVDPANEAPTKPPKTVFLPEICFLTIEEDQRLGMEGLINLMDTRGCTLTLPGYEGPGTFKVLFFDAPAPQLRTAWVRAVDYEGLAAFGSPTFVKLEGGIENSRGTEEDSVEVTYGHLTPGLEGRVNNLTSFEVRARSKLFTAIELQYEGFFVPTNPIQTTSETL